MTNTYYCPPLNDAGIGNNDWGAAWGDAIGSVRQVIKNGFTAEAYRDTGHVLEFNKHNLDSTISGEIQFDHEYALDTEIRFHVHVLPMANGSGDVYWTWQYFFATRGVAIPAVASWTTGNTTTSLVAADLYEQSEQTIFSVTPSGSSTSGVLLYDVTRASTNILDTYATNKDHGTAQANLGILYVDAHHQRNKPGTLTEFA